MQGIIGIEHYKIRCIVGVYPKERQALQEIYLDLRVRFDMARCSESQQLSDTLDWKELAQICSNLAQTRHYQLIENFAHEALEALLQKEAITWAWVKVKKPKALSEALYTYVEIERAKS
jgi:7,8-dihydroneopterin aldolase/epimerase/oxygenase